MEKKYYYLNHDGARKGPYSLEQLLAEPINEGTLIWYEGLSNWKKISDISDVFEVISAKGKFTQTSISVKKETEPIKYVSNTGINCSVNNTQTITSPKKKGKKIAILILLSVVSIIVILNAIGVISLKDVYESISKNISKSTLTDIDGNIYSTVKIGNQVWLGENLKVTHYRNGDPIPNVVKNKNWINLTSGAYCNYNNDINNKNIYGCLYNWNAVADNRNIAPLGWHVSSVSDWTNLEKNLGGSIIAGGKLKEIGTAHWYSPNTGATNESGFTALPGGGRFFEDGSFVNIGYFCAWWSDTEVEGNAAWFYGLTCITDSIYRNAIYKNTGNSVRLVKD